MGRKARYLTLAEKTAALHRQKVNHAQSERYVVILYIQSMFLTFKLLLAGGKLLVNFDILKTMLKHTAAKAHLSHP
jgi:hypothetical protein